MKTKQKIIKNRFLTFLGFLLFCSIGLQGQNGTNKLKIYKVWITLTDDSTVNGYLYSADKESIDITNSRSMESSNLTTINPASISKIKIRRKGKIGRGALIGGLSGAVIGVLGGYISGDDEPGWFSSTAEEKAGGGAIVFGTLGTGIGALVASIKKEININGDLNIYAIHLELLQSYSLMPISK